VFNAKNFSLVVVMQHENAVVSKYRDKDKYLITSPELPEPYNEGIFTIIKISSARANGLDGHILAQCPATGEKRYLCKQLITSSYSTDQNELKNNS
jgi:hypothetical protein